MEENRPFMPPPPPKMPPPPPRPDVTGQTPVQPQAMEQGASVQAEQPAVQPQVDEGFSTENVLEQSERGDVEPQDMAVGESAKKEKTPKAKKKVSIATLLYWGGFALCVVGIALSIYFLVK